MSYQAANDELEVIEADAWFDLYDAAPRVYANENGLRSHRFGQALCLVHENLISPEFARVVGATNAQQLSDAINWMKTEAKPGWVAQVPSREKTTRMMESLEQSGFTARGNGWTKFRLAHAPAIRAVNPLISVRQVFQNDASTFGNVVQSAFGLPPSTQEWFAQLPGRQGWSTFLAYSDEEPIACGSMYVRGSLAWMGIGATKADYRGQGAQSMLLRARIVHGQTLGVTLFTAETGQPNEGSEDEHISYSNCRKAGFEPVYTRINYGLGN